MKFLTKYLFFILFFIFFLNGNAWGQITYTWSSSSSNDWGTSTNWSPIGVPGASDDVVFDGSSAVSCSIVSSFNFSAQVRSITVKNTYTGTLSMDIGESTLNAETIVFELGTTAQFIIGNFGSVNIYCNRFDMQGGTFIADVSASGIFKINHDINLFTSIFNVQNPASFSLGAGFTVEFGSGVSGQTSDITYTNQDTTPLPNVKIMCESQIMTCNSDLIVSGNLVLESGAVNNGSTAKLKLGGINDNDITIDNGFLGGNLPIEFVESGKTILNNTSFGQSVTISNDIIINKTNRTDILFVNCPLSLIGSNITFEKGIIEMKSDPLILSSNVNITGAGITNGDSFVLGTLQYTTPGGGDYFIPVGIRVDTDYYAMPIAISYTASNTFTVRAFGAAYTTTVLGNNITRVSQRSYWNINSNSAITGVGIKFYVLNNLYQDINSVSFSTLGVAKYSETPNPNWVDGTTSITNAPDLVQTTFDLDNSNNTFSFVSKSPTYSINLLGNPLPVGATCSNAKDVGALQSMAPFYDNASLNDAFALTSDDGLSGASFSCSGTALQEEWLNLKTLAAGTYSIEYTSSKDVGLEVYASCSTFVACKNDYPAGGTEKITFTTAGGIIYLVRIINYTDALGLSGAVTMRKTATPVGELACDAVSFTVNNSATPFNINADFQNHESRSAPTCISSLGNKNDGWVKFTAASNNTTIQYTNTNQDATIEVYSDGINTNPNTNCNSLTAISGACTNAAVVGTETLTLSTVLGKIYYVRIVNNVSSTDMNGNITIFDALPIVTLTPPTTINANSFEANWQAIAGVDFYELDVSNNSAFSSFVSGYNANNVGDVLTFPVTGLNANNTYYYRVRAFKNGVLSANQTLANITANKALTLLPTPTANNATAITGTSFKANWTSVAGATGYSIDVATDNTFIPASLISGSPFIVGTVTNTTITTLTSNTQYFYRVKAIKTTNLTNRSNYSDTIVVNTLNEITAPTNAIVSNITQTSFKLSWDIVLNVDGYNVDVATNPGFTVFVPFFNNRIVNNGNTFIDVAGLNPNTQYYFRVRAYISSTTSPYSTTTSITTSTIPPTAISATAITSTSFTTNWNQVVGADSYQIDIATDANFTNFTTLTSSTNSLIVSTATTGTIYYYRVRAVNALNSVSGNSNVVAVITNPIATSATDVAVISFTANWQQVIGATAYTLQVSAPGDNMFTTLPLTFDADVTTNSQVISGLVGATTYYYRVKAKLNTVISDYSNEITVTTMLLAPSAPIANNALSISDTQFTAFWDITVGATGYEIDIATNNTFTPILNTFTNTGNGNNTITLSTALPVNAGTIYYYRVRAVNAGGASFNSNVISLITTPNSPTTTAVTATSFVANWIATAGASNYTLQVSSNSGFTNFAYNQNITGTSQNITGLTTGTLYYVRIKVNANTPNAINSDFSANSQVTPILQAPDAPIATSATNVFSDAFTANWNVVAGAASYQIDIALDGGFSNFTTVTSNTNNVNVPAAANTTYYYRVRAINTAGNSPNSNEITVTTPAISNNLPETPTDLSPFAVSSTSIEVSWIDESNNEIGFELYRKEGLTGAYSINPIYTAPANVTANSIVSYVDTGLNPNTTYYYKVRALGANGNSPYSVENFTITLPIDIARPTFLEAPTVSISSIELNWVDNATNETGYNIYRAEQGGDFALITTLLGSNINTFTDIGLLNATTYFYYVEAIIGTNAKSLPSNVAGATTADVPLRPRNFIVTNINTTSVTLNWTDESTNEERFVIEVSSLASNGFFVFLKEVPANSITTNVTGLAPNQQYKFRIYAENEAGESPGVVSSQVTTLIDTSVQPPVAPTEPFAEAISTIEVGIRWKYNKNAVALFIVERSNNATTGFTEVGRLLATKLNFNDIKGLIAGQTYYYRVIASNAGGNSAPSTVVSVKVQCNITTVINTDQSASGNIACDSKQVLLQLSSNVSIGRFQWFKNGIAIPNATFTSHIATETGEYYCRILAGDCDKKSEIKPVLIVPSFIVQIALTGQTLTSNRLGAGTYQWYYEYQPVSGAVQDNYTPTRPGVYYLQVTQGTCSVISNLYTFAPTALEMSFTQALQIYPNPAQEEISVKIEHAQMGNFEIFGIDMQGRKISLAKGYKDDTIYTQTVNVSQLSKGLYLLEVNMNGMTGQKKLIKR